MLFRGDTIVSTVTRLLAASASQRQGHPGQPLTAVHPRSRFSAFISSDLISSPNVMVTPWDLGPRRVLPRGDLSAFLQARI